MIQPVYNRIRSFLHNVFKEKAMAHIKLPDGVPGILGPLMAYPDSATHLNGLAEAVLRGPSSLTEAEREMIAAFVSSGNDCYFCANSHAAAARHLLGDEAELVDDILNNGPSAEISDKMRVLLGIAGKIRRDGRLVTGADIDDARAAGADDKAIHDTVLIASMFCMYNRYVDGLGTWAPRNRTLYDQLGARLATRGYVST
jgi:uncharacterized peroxidase-related enzyme